MASWREGALQWLPELGVGYYPVQEQPYNAAYWQRYRDMDQTPTGAELTVSRIGLVDRHYRGPLIDVGIGGGRFVEDRPGTYGYDVNPLAVEWLQTAGAYWNPYKCPCEAASFWDSLEHIHRPDVLLRNVSGWVFGSMPIYMDAEHILRSKHFRKDEHCWYFTRAGLERFMARLGFALREWNTMEQDAGREDIHSFAFERVSA